MTIAEEKALGFNPRVISILHQDLSNYFTLRIIPHISAFLLLVLTTYYLCVWSFRNLYPENASVSDIVNIFTNRIGVIITLLINIYYITFYVLQLSFIEKFKVNQVPWPWQEDKVKWRKMFKKTVFAFIINDFILFPIIFYIMTYFFKPIASHLLVPSFWTCLWQMAIMLLIEDFIFYWIHRMLHLPIFYKLIHKKHHEHYNTFHLTNIYAHWIEFSFGNVLPMLLGMILLKGNLHVVTLNIFIILRIVESTEGHSGYDFPWSCFKIFSFSTDSAYHNYHHLKNNGNYADIFTFWDTIFGTNKDYYQVLNVHLEVKTKTA